MKRKFTIFSIILAIFFFGLALVATPALARDRVTKGEALSVLNAWNTGRIAVRLNNGVGAAHFEDPFNVAILPFGNFNGRHYCEEDYLVPLLGWIAEEETYQAAKASLDTVQHEIWIDGQQYETIRTPVAARVGGSPGPFAFSEGAIVEPGALSVGLHSYEVPIYFDGSLIATLSIEFYIDAAGTGVCQ